MTEPGGRAPGPEGAQVAPSADDAARRPLWRRLLPRRRGWRIFLSSAAAFVGLAVLAGALVPLPYVLIAPGSATSVDDVVAIKGADTFEPDGSVLFLTVSVTDEKPNAFTVLDGWLDDTVTVKDWEDVYRGRSKEEDERENVALMDLSQVYAKKVSLERLGYEVPVNGFQVFDVEKGSPADGVLETGDVITAVDGAPATNFEDLGDAVRLRRPGETLEVALIRGDEPRTVAVGTRAAPEGPHRGEAQMGVTAPASYDFPVDIEIDTGSVSGPSAGLAFTITILDELTPGDLTGGENVAVTGTIGPDGEVGAIGGVEQKAVAARRAGVELFIVPNGDLREARRHADGMKVVGVDDLDGALAALEDAGGDPLPSPGAPPA